MKLNYGLLLGLLAAGGAPLACDSSSDETGGGGISTATGAGMGGSAGSGGNVGAGGTGIGGGTAGSGGTAGGGTAGAGGGELQGCDYVKVYEQNGVVLNVVDGASYWQVQPLAAGEGLRCARLEFDMQTADNLAELANQYTGCPVYQAIGRIAGTGSTGEKLGDAYFHYYTAGCTPGAQRLEIDNFLDHNNGTSGPWPVGETWRVSIRIEPDFARVTLSQGSQQVGPAVECSLDNANGTWTVDNTRNPRFALGQAQIAGGAYFPWYGSVYSNVEIWADVVSP